MTYNIGVKNPMFGKKGKFCPNWKGGRPKCKCGKQLVSYSSKMCRSCVNKERWEQPNYRQKVGLKISDTRKKLNLAVGENNSNWRGGVTAVRTIIRKCKRYKLWQDKVRNRDNFTCQLCKKRGSWIEVDHYPKSFTIILKENNIKTYREGLECQILWDIENGRVLCRKCHKLVHILK